MLTRFEAWVLRLGLEVVHLRAALWIYALYLAWNILSIGRHLAKGDTLSLAHMYVDSVDILLLLAAVVFALRWRLWLERLTVTMLALNGFGQQVLRAIHNFIDGQDPQLEVLLAGLVFAILFLTRAVSLTYKIARIRFRLTNGIN